MSAVIESTVGPTVVEPRSERGEPVWEIARLYPPQGEWSESQYLALDTNRLIEFTDGVLEFLPMPSFSHQMLSSFLNDVLKAHVTAHHLGVVLYAPYRVQIRPGKHREPDVMFISPKHQKHDQYTAGADLVIEIVSEGDEARERDLIEKRNDYAEAGIPEYWIVDPEQQAITVLTLDGDTYREHGIFRQSETATSVLLDGFAVDVTACFAAAETMTDEGEEDAS